MSAVRARQHPPTLPAPSSNAPEVREGVSQAPQHARLLSWPSSAHTTATGTGGEGGGDPQQGRGGGPARAQDAVGRLDQIPHLGGAVVSCDLLTLVAEKVLAIFQTDSR